MEVRLPGWPLTRALLTHWGQGKQKVQSLHPILKVTVLIQGLVTLLPFLLFIHLFAEVVTWYRQQKELETDPYVWGVRTEL